jgi:hypothetical protein
MPSPLHQPTSRVATQTAWLGVRGWVLGGCVLLACSGSSGGSVSASQAATDGGNALCAKINSCAPFAIQVDYGDVATCASGVAASLLAALQANGTGWTPSGLESCVSAIPSVSCDDALGNDLLAMCRPAGTLATGSACGDSAQCTSSYCNLGTSGKCGTCAAALGSAGTACYRDGDCAISTVCVGSDVTATPEVQGTCTALGAAGATCDAKTPCAKTLACGAGVCATPAAAGASCTQDGTDVFGSCDELAGDYCSKATAGVCTAISAAATGQPCGSIGGVLTTCSTSGLCVTPSTGTGSCVAPAADFANCDTKKGPGCQAPAACIGGMCTIPTPTSCP